MDKLSVIKTGKWLHGIDRSISARLMDTEEMCFRLNALSPRQVEERGAIIHELFGRVGDGCVLHSPFHCDFGSNISIGRNFVGNFNLTILDEADVVIGDNVFIGPNVGIYTVMHAMTATQRNEGVMTARPVTIGDNVWIGAHAVILPGVSIGSGTVIGAGSIVTRSMPPRVMAAGNPCRVIRCITDQDRVDTVD